MKTKNVAIYFSVVLLLVLVTFITINTFSDNIFITRIFSAVEIDSSGNFGRINNWQHGIDAFLNSYFILGTYTGMVTNSTANFDLGESFIVESGLLQQLDNFGVLGALFYYALLILLTYTINAKFSFFRAILIAAILQTFVYQSIEVLPFMQLLALIPQVIDHMEKDDLDKKNCFW